MGVSELGRSTNEHHTRANLFGGQEASCSTQARMELFPRFQWWKRWDSAINCYAAMLTCEKKIDPDRDASEHAVPSGGAEDDALLVTLHNSMPERTHVLGGCHIGGQGGTCPTSRRQPMRACLHDGHLAQCHSINGTACQAHERNAHVVIGHSSCLQVEVPHTTLQGVEDKGVQHEQASRCSSGCPLVAGHTAPAVGFSWYRQQNLHRLTSMITPALEKLRMLVSTIGRV